MRPTDVVQTTGAIAGVAAIFLAGALFAPIFAGGPGPKNDDNPVGYRAQSQGQLRVDTERPHNSKTTTTTCSGSNCEVYLDVIKYPRSKSQDCEYNDSPTTTGACPQPTCPPAAVTCVTFEGDFDVRHVSHHGHRHTPDPQYQHLKGIFYVLE